MPRGDGDRGTPLRHSRDPFHTAPAAVSLEVREVSPPGTAKLWCGQSGMGAESFGFVGRGCTRQQHSAPPREYLLVFKDIDMKRGEESSALIGERTSSTSLEFRLGTAQRRPNCRARIITGAPVAVRKRENNWRACAEQLPSAERSRSLVSPSVSAWRPDGQQT